MFVDERTSCNIHADLDCTIIRGTLRTCDLIPAFLDVIRDTAEYDQIMISNNYLVQAICDPTINENDEIWESEDMIYFLNEELFDTLNSYAPDGYYFGAHIGDGSDFGFWKSEDCG